MKGVRKYKKYFATFFAICLLSDILIPTFSYAITGHDSMPEYRSFEPVATTNMVNVFDGSFTYNIPLLEIPNGYPLSLSYHNNETNPDALASWVGWGWTLNPGAINRVKRGFPDEYNGKIVKYHSKMPANWTISASVGVQPEIFGDESLVDVDFGTTVRYNNYSGLGTSIDLGFGFAGVASLDLSYSNGRFGFNPDINPGELFMVIKQTFKERKNRKTGDQDPSQSTGEKKNSSLMQALKKRKEIRDQGVPKGANQKPQIGFSLGGIGTLSSSGSNFGSSLAAMIQPTSYPTSVSDYTGGMVNLKLAVGLNIFPLPIDGEAYVKGGFTVQVNKPSQDIPVYGYLHSEDGYVNDNAMMDYFTENESIYEKRDNILAVPLPNNDIYNVTGEALGGAFRPFRPEFGHYRKNYVKSENFSVQVGADINLPLVPSIPGANLEFTVGVEAGGHYHYSAAGNWNQSLRGDVDVHYKFKANNQFVNSNEKFFFRFSGDLGGSFSLIKNDDPYKPELVNNNLGLGNSSLDFGTPASFNNNVFKINGIDDRTSRRRSSYINYHLNSDFSQTSSTFKYKVYENNLEVLNSLGNPVSYNHNNSTYYNSDAMGEFVTHNADGVRYVYGLPVYTRKEKELQYSLKSSQVSSIDAGLIAYISNATGVINGKRKIGYESDESYPNAHLLTQINSPDYIDRTGDGPTEDDFGSYTRFNYQRTAGESGNWYTYRTPHTGMSYNQGSLSDPDDDMGGFSTGQKELYYLHSIASKTHVAFFTLSDREDGLDANLTNSPTEDILITGVGNSTTPIKLKKLSKIDLYSINDCVKISGSIYRPKNQSQDGFNALPIKTVRFEYDYSLCKNLPNNSHAPDNDINGVNINNVGFGKLTLRKLWFEYEGKLTSKISPYVFDYEYPTTTYPAPYSNLQYGSLYPTSKQNPDYSPLLTDRWGNYRNFMGLQAALDASTSKPLSRFWPFVNQKDDPDYDPAAWCLKKIKLPSGGEIHIQYEEHDYQFVQDKRAMMMVPLASNTTPSETGTGEKKYYLDLAKVGITKDRLGNTLNFNDADPVKAVLRKEIAEDLFHTMEFEDKDRIYFNFLYALVDGNPSYSSFKSDYIEGYARIHGYGMDANGIYFKFKSNANSALISGTDFYTKISYSSEVSQWELPYKACKNFVNTQRKGKLGNPPPGKALEDAFNSGSGEGMITAFADLLDALTNLVQFKCTEFDPLMSFVRVQVPLVKAKRGGGVRVKRLLMFDEGVKSSDPNVLYGQEYTYTTAFNGHIISSGVASNEPAIGRRENPLVNPIPKDEQSTFSALLFGRDMYSQEGPLGESLLPGPSVGYSSVTVSSIHRGKTSTGTEVHEYFTYRDAPMVAKRTSIQQKSPTQWGLSAGAGGVSVSYSRKDPYMAQGYSFISYSLSGQPKRTSKYAAGLSNSPIAEEIYEYFKPGDQIKRLGEGLQIETVPFEEMGKESEMLSDIRQVEDISTGGNIGLDLSVGVLLPYPFLVPPIIIIIPTGLEAGFFVNEQIIRTHVTTKVINYPAVLKKSINIADGVTHTTEYTVFDKFTGSPVTVKTTDDFGGTYLSEDFKAAWKYDNMQAKSQNENLIIKADANTTMTYQSGVKEYIVFGGNNGCGALANFTRGDLLKIMPASSVALYHVHEIDFLNNRLHILPSQMKSSSPNTTVTELNILRSGYTNQLNTKMGNIMKFGTSSSTSITPIITTHAFVTELNNKIDLNATANGSCGNFTVSAGAPYEHIDVSFFSSEIPAGCVSDLKDVAVMSVNFHFKVTNSVLNLQITSFTIRCDNNSTQLIQCNLVIPPC